MSSNSELSKVELIIDSANKFIKIINFMVLDLKTIRNDKNKATFTLSNLENSLLRAIETLKDILYLIDKKSSKKGKSNNEVEFLLFQLESILIIIQNIKKKYGSSFLNKNILLEKDLDFLFKKINRFGLDYKKKCLIYKITFLIINLFDKAAL
jgi:hypothetical protein